MPNDVTTYRLAPALAGRLVGAALVVVALVVVAITVITALAGLSPGILAAAGGVVVVVMAGLTWWLFRRAWVVRLTAQGYDVRWLRAAGASTATWSDVHEVAAASPQGVACLQLRLRDGRTTLVPMTALAADRDAFALDVRARLRDAHSPDPDSVAERGSL